MAHSSNGLAEGQFPPERDDLNLSLGKHASIVSLGGLLDLISALDAEISEMPYPYPRFAHELADGIAASTKVAE